MESTKVTFNNSTLMEMLNAVKGGKIENVKSLINKYPHIVNATDSAGKTPMYYAVQRMDELMAKLLITNGADAPSSEYIQAVKILAGSGANVTQEQYLQAREVLIKCDEVNAVDSNGETKLHLSAQKGNIAHVRNLIKYGANINAVNKLGYTPLMCTLWYEKPGQLEKTKLLLELGANPNIPDKDGICALHIAVARSGMAQDGVKYGDIVKLLLEYGADVDVTHNGETPLLTVFAGMNKNMVKLEMAKLLIRNGAQINEGVKQLYNTKYYASKFDNNNAYNIPFDQYFAEEIKAGKQYVENKQKMIIDEETSQNAKDNLSAGPKQAINSSFIQTTKVLQQEEEKGNNNLSDNVKGEGISLGQILLEAKQQAVINNGRLNPSVSGSRENSKDPKKQKSNNGQGK